jgi:hypothetical protein
MKGSSEECVRVRFRDGRACDLLPAEVLNMSQLRMLSLRVDQTAFNVWTQQQAALVPSLHRAVSPL